MPRSAHPRPTARRPLVVPPAPGLDLMPTLPQGPVVVYRDGAAVSPWLPTEGDALAWLHRAQPMSADWALTHEGYELRSLGAGPWPVAEARSRRRQAEQITRHGHGLLSRMSEHEREVTADNCAACALLDGHGELSAADSSHGVVEPNYGGWASIYVRLTLPVPARWRQALIVSLDAEVTSPGYAQHLARDLATWGVRYVD